jgi:hypothetical protein
MGIIGQGYEVVRMNRWRVRNIESSRQISWRLARTMAEGAAEGSDVSVITLPGSVAATAFAFGGFLGREIIKPPW